MNDRHLRRSLRRRGGGTAPRAGARTERCDGIQNNRVHATVFGGGLSRLGVVRVLAEHGLNGVEIEGRQNMVAALEAPVATVLTSRGPAPDEVRGWFSLRVSPGSVRATVLMGRFCGRHELAVFRGLGIHGFLGTAVSEEALVEAVRAANAGHRFCDPDIPLRPDDPYGLTDRQLAVLGGLSMFANDREIARLLGLREDTVAREFEAIYGKMDVENRGVAWGTAIQNGLLGTADFRARCEL